MVCVSVAICSSACWRGFVSTLVRNNNYDCVCPGTPNDEDMEDEDMLEVVFS